MRGLRGDVGEVTGSLDFLVEALHADSLGVVKCGDVVLGLVRNESLRVEFV